MTTGESNPAQTKNIHIDVGCGGVELRGRIVEQLVAARQTAEETGNEPAFNPLDVPRIFCEPCQGLAIADSQGGVIAPKCNRQITSAKIITCALSLARTHPELFEDKNGNFPEGSMGCTACTGCVMWEERGVDVRKTRPLLRGSCAVNAEGENFRHNGRDTLNRALPPIKTVGNTVTEALPAFDGEPNQPMVALSEPEIPESASPQ
jgi:hypothetical protein